MKKGESDSNLRGVSVPVQRAFPHSGHAQIGREQKYYYINRRPTTDSTTAFSLAPVSEKRFVKEAEYACYIEEERGSTQRNPFVVKYYKIAFGAARPSGPCLKSTAGLRV